MSSNGNLYQTIRKLWKEANPYKSVKVSELEFLDFWKLNKSDREALESKKNDLELKKRANGKPLIQSWFRQVQGNLKKSSDPEECEIVSVESSVDYTGGNDDNQDQSVGVFPRKKRPEQEKTVDAINTINKRISDLVNARAAGLLTHEHIQELKRLKAELAVKNAKLQRLKTLRKAQSKHRKKQRKVLEGLRQTQPEKLGDLSVQQDPGRPRLEESQPGLLDAIVDIVKTYASADQKRRTESMRYVKTLDQLLVELQEMGFNISRSGLYFRLLPRDGSTASGKRHTLTVPVKLARPQNSMRKDHEDSRFAASTIQFLKDLAGIFGNEAVFVLSQDDKARVPLGLPAANKQGPILMSMDYKVTLPDHDWVVATRHKLIPSVYAALEIRDRKVSYSGPTYIAIRSGKHDSSTAYTHAVDLNRLIHLDVFSTFSLEAGGNTKPIWIILVDGGPDENPRYPKTLLYAVQHFVSNNLDALYIATNAPHQSAYNPVERRMAPLSKDLCGIILPHDHYGTHLDKSGKTIDPDLEVKNFEKAGTVLASIWSQRVIDNFDVLAEYIKPPGSGSDTLPGTGSTSSYTSYVTEAEPAYLTENWKMRHVRQSNYMLQIVKCNDISCCRAPKTNIHKFLKGQFLPPPVKFRTTSEGIQLASDESAGDYFDLCSRLAWDFLVPPQTPFDKYCPSIKSSLKAKLCPICGLYCVTKKALMSHRRVHVGVAPIEDPDDQCDDQSVLLDANLESEIHQIFDMSLWLKQPFAELV